MTPTATAAIQTSKPLRTGHVIMADNSTAVPDQIEVMKAGMWPASSNKGQLIISTADLQEFKANFDNGVGMPKDLKQLPIDFSHADYMQAAGWITGLEVQGNSLMASVNWSAEGKAALEGGMYKCISPSFYPGCVGQWCDPEDPDITASNVLVGAGLTNIPFFKALTPIMASTAPQSGKNVQADNIIYIQADEKEQNTMTLDEIRVKDQSALTDEEKTFLAENKAELSAEEQTKFGLDEKTTDPAEPKTNKEEEPVADPELEAVTASLKSGEMVAVKASVFNQLQSDVKNMKRKEIVASVTQHVARGAIKADQITSWADQIEANADSEKLLAALPDNPVMASQQGSSVAEKSLEDAENELHEKVVAARTEEKNKGKSYAQVRASILKEDKELATTINGGQE